MVITSVSNPKIKELIALNDKKVMRETRTFIVEGINIVKDIPPSVKILKYVAVCGIPLAPLSVREGVEIITVSENVFARLSRVKNPQGVAAVAEIPEGRIDDGQNALILDRVRDPGNVGTLLRSAAAFGFFNAVLIDCADACSQKVLRSSMGGVFKLNVIEADEKDIFNFLHREKYRFFGLDADGEDIKNISEFKDGAGGKAALREVENISEFKSEVCNKSRKAALAGSKNISEFKDERGSGEKKTALIVGNEADGISNFLRGACDGILSIGMSGEMESLNAAVAGSIAMHLFFSKD
ncbi:MAG: RNA methyltransferase [Clostridiales bacterium]|jgi:TrmH family RNA methyltransferase|nr:RNA methyltransferase [Clostridiales bacterium]